MRREQPPTRFEGDIPILAGPEDPEKTAHDKEKVEESEYKGRQITIQSRMLLTQAALVIFGVVGSGISAYQAYTAHISAEQAVRASNTAACALRESRAQFQETLKQMQTQSDAMRKSADSEIAASRAWIVPDAPPINKHSIEEANLEWHNAGKTPAIAVFSSREYFTGDFPHHLRPCVELERKLKQQPVDTWQYQPFVSENGRYEIGNDHVPAWVGQQPISIHGCVWYTDILSNSEKSTEFFLQAFQKKYAYPQSEGVSLFYLADRPFIYR
jgi:hypothetical protein